MSGLSNSLAINGGPKAKTTPNIAMYPGGLAIGDEEKKAVMEVLDSKYLFRYYGPSDFQSRVQLFENDFAEKMGSKFCLALNSCTSALITSFIAVGVGPGDEVILPGYTFFASCAAVIAAKAIPVIAEVDDSLTLDPNDIESKITSRTRAILAVHMRGVPCDMDRITDIARKHKLILIEDVAQACGGSYKGKRLGNFGECGAFSFQYHKIITAGEGGAIITADERLYDRAQGYHDTAACWRPGGEAKRFATSRHEGELFPGVNFRMGEMSGALMRVQLTRLDGFLEKTRAHKVRIKSAISSINSLTFRRLNDPSGDTAICLVMYLPEPDIATRFATALQAEGVNAQSIFNKGVPDWHIYSHWEMILNKWTPTAEGCPYTCPYYIGKGGDMRYSPDMNPNTLALLGRSVHIDIPPQMTDEDCDMIAEAIIKVSNAYL